MQTAGICSGIVQCGFELSADFSVPSTNSTRAYGWWYFTMPNVAWRRLCIRVQRWAKCELDWITPRVCWWRAFSNASAQGQKLAWILLCAKQELRYHIQLIVWLRRKHRKSWLVFPCQPPLFHGCHHTKGCIWYNASWESTYVFCITGNDVVFLKSSNSWR